MKREINSRQSLPRTAGVAGIIAAGVAAASASATVVEIPIEEAAPTVFWSFGDNTTPNPNIILDFGQGLPAVITGIGWDFTVSASGEALLSDFGLGLFNATSGFDPEQGDGFLLAPAEGDSFGGTAQYSTGGIITLADISVNDLFLDQGFFYGELFSWSGQPGLVVEGSVSFQYVVIPAPGAAALFGFAAFFGGGRRR